VRLWRAGDWLVLPATGALITAALAGCAANQSASGSSTAPPPAPTQAPTASPGAPPTAAEAPGRGACHTGDLSAQLAAKTTVPVDVQGELGAAGTHYSVNLVWTNRSHRTCTMRGFGGVDMDGPDQGSTGRPRYSLPRTADTPSTVTLAPGASAHTTISYIDPTGSQPDSRTSPAWTPTHLEVTPPDETTQLSVPWTPATPVYQDPEDGAAAASISPVTAGSQNR
jgi:hypothetical protein